MLIIYSIVLGIVQGLTEFLPVSSSGHLVILHEFLDFNIADSLSFDVALHLGTLFALLIFFRSDVIKLLKAFLNSFKDWDLKYNSDQRLVWLILLSTIPAAVVGYFFEDAIESVFRSVYVVIVTLLIGALLFFIFENISKKSSELAELTWRSALLIGLAQVLALIPGVSRSGITIIAGLGVNLKRDEAAKFSFLMAIPIIFGAGLVKIIDLLGQGLDSDQLILFVIGFLSALISGYFCVKYFLRYLKGHSLNIFGIYRILLSIIITILIIL